MEPEVIVSLAGAVVIPAAAVIYRFVQKVNAHELILPRMEAKIDRVETKLDNLTGIVLQSALDRGTKEG